MLLTKSGDVYTWSLSNIGQGGTLTRMSTPYENEMTVTTSMPVVVSNLKGIKIIDIACGGCPLTGDSFSLALTDSGVVYSWGDGDFGKLGRGGSEGMYSFLLIIFFVSVYNFCLHFQEAKHLGSLINYKDSKLKKFMLEDNFQLLYAEMEPYILGARAWDIGTFYINV